VYYYLWRLLEILLQMSHLLQRCVMLLTVASLCAWKSNSTLTVYNISGKINSYSSLARQPDSCYGHFTHSYLALLYYILVYIIGNLSWFHLVTPVWWFSTWIPFIRMRSSAPYPSPQSVQPIYIYLPGKYTWNMASMGSPTNELLPQTYLSSSPVHASPFAKAKNMSSKRWWYHGINR
jgi:hypothetical protein